MIVFFLYIEMERKEYKRLTKEEFDALLTNYVELSEEEVVKLDPRKHHLRYYTTNDKGDTRYFKGGYLIKVMTEYISLGNTNNADIMFQLVRDGKYKSNFTFATWWVDRGKNTKWFRKKTEEEFMQEIAEKNQHIAELDRLLAEMKKNEPEKKRRTNKKNV